MVVLFFFLCCLPSVVFTEPMPHGSASSQRPVLHVRMVPPKRAHTQVVAEIGSVEKTLQEAETEMYGSVMAAYNMSLSHAQVAIDNVIAEVLDGFQSIGRRGDVSQRPGLCWFSWLRPRIFRHPPCAMAGFERTASFLQRVDYANFDVKLNTYGPRTTPNTLVPYSQPYSASGGQRRRVCFARPAGNLQV